MFHAVFLFLSAFPSFGLQIMFPTTHLFRGVLCPIHKSCTLYPCLFSHEPSACMPGGRSINVSAQASTSKAPLRTVTPPMPPQKRPLLSDSAIEPPHKVTRTISHATVRSDVSSKPLITTTETSIRSNGSPITNGKMASTSSTSYAAPSWIPSSDTGPPRVAPIAGANHTPYAIRQKMLTTLYNEYLSCYSNLPDSRMMKDLASQHSKAQERYIYGKSNKATYRNAVISAMARMKKRPKAQSLEETGTLEQEAARLKALDQIQKERMTRERVSRYISSKDTLKRFDYMIELPAEEGGSMPDEEGNIKKCDRCGVEWLVKGDLDLEDRKKCSFHFGKMVTERLGGKRERVFSCCPAPAAPPCSQGPHVFRDNTLAALHSRIPFVTTSALAPEQLSTHLDIVALDCELVYTTSGMALARLTVVDSEGSVVLDEHVKPQGSLLDTNLRFSGVKEEHIQSAVLDISGVRHALAKFVGPDTIVCGHALENDLKALRLVHLTVIDTAIIFPHPNGGSWRHALRNLTRDILGKFIQDSDPSLGHSAVEDSRAALELIRYKMKHDLGLDR